VSENWTAVLPAGILVWRDLGSEPMGEDMGRGHWAHLPAGASEGTEASSPSTLDFSRLLADPVTPPGTGHRWPSVSALRLRRSVGELITPALSHHAVFVNVGRPYRLEAKLDGRVYQTFGVKGHVALLPAGMTAEFRTWERKPQEVESFVMLLDPAFVRGIAEAEEVDANRIEMMSVLGARQPEIERIGMALLSELQGGGLYGDLYAESLATSLSVHLLRHFSSLSPGTVRATELATTGGLSKAELRRVTDYIEENLVRTVTLAEIAGVAHISPFYFSRLFKRSTGLSPHQYVVHRRLERATSLLVNTSLPLHEVASLSGFADQSHLAKHTRRRLGVSPTSLRLASG
jgi:AraC family transcriptional regulator